ncbi:MAG: M48 family metalloprotease [Azoarcus sp.]|nr:M48 family metalloprotease [Azoarcus sp.]
MNRYSTVGGSLLAALLVSACLSSGDAGQVLSSAAGTVSEATSTTASSSGEDKTEARVSAGLDVFKAATVSDEELQAATRQMVAQMDKQNEVAPAANKYAKRLEKLTKGLKNEDGVQLNFKVYLTKDVNAFATPDGSIRVFSGLMDLMKDDHELRSILGHEIGHVKLGHSLKAARTAYLASAAAKVAVSESGGGLGAQVLADLGEKFLNAQFSQSQESEADAYGVEFMKRHKYKLAAAESAMRKLAELDGGGGSAFASHPGSKERADKIHELISQ